ncbi:uncharacterized protein EURHEDRAFT_413885 [Aspergillus ruber CBS 135680]|uniref:Uncharacterized protein n=1 Tax=Aspergillus ruber (strain CBS 135680) TaxID=1388766 RepID=A0A017SA01_ASPRC|nr:uncharacterized protein EURHEDRAFT_413885 [Aspergillus ruber CBS 135680]EYE93883.1 hypothetical protein EURHEDRAFT_413885 [Aspergillus ruber CBS 135680]
MNVLKAIRWGLQGWEYGVSGRAIQNCFQKAPDSQIQYQEPVDTAVMDDIQASFSQLQLSTPIQDLMDIKAFLNPRGGQELEILPKVSAEEAIAAIQRLRLYEEQQVEGSPAFIREVERHERIIWRRKLDLQSQRDIGSYFSY